MGSSLPAPSSSASQRVGCKLKSLLRKELRGKEKGEKRWHLFNQGSELQSLMNSRFSGTPGQVREDRSQNTLLPLPCVPLIGGGGRV